MIEISDKYTKPMMSDIEIDVVDKLLVTKPNMMCLEWGSGNSTIYFSTIHHLKHWISIEHDEDYARYVIQHTDRSKVTVMPIPEGPTYYESMLPYAGVFDFILVDGRMREQCVKIALKIARKDTIVLLHDASREEYHWWLREYAYDELTKGEIPDGRGFYKHRGLAQFFI